MISGTYIPLANPNVKKKNTAKKELSLNLILIVKNIYIFQKAIRIVTHILVQTVSPKSPALKVMSWPQLFKSWIALSTG